MAFVEKIALAVHERYDTLDNFLSGRSWSRLHDISSGGLLPQLSHILIVESLQVSVYSTDLKDSGP